MPITHHLPPPPGIHIIIKGILHPIGLEFFEQFREVIAVQHKEGLVQKERPHFHIWIPIGHVEQLKKDLRKFYDARIPGLEWNTHANAYYTVKDYDKFENWIEYVYNPQTAKCKKPTIELWRSPQTRPPPLPEVIEVNELIYETGDPTNVQEPKVIITKDKSKRESASARFLKYCKQEEMENATIEEVAEAWIEWTKGSYELRNVTAPIRHAYFMLNGEDPRIKAMMRGELMEKFSHYRV